MFTNLRIGGKADLKREIPIERGVLESLSIEESWDVDPSMAISWFKIQTLG
ncbi:MAG TPA: hypothetical protein VGC09_22015 [Rhodopila sp.]